MLQYLKLEFSIKWEIKLIQEVVMETERKIKHLLTFLDLLNCPVLLAKDVHSALKSDRNSAEAFCYS